MQSLPDRCAHLVIADPPYNLGKKFGDGPRWTDVDKWLPWCRLWLREIARLLHPEGNVFVFGIHHYLCYIQCFLYELELHYRRQIIWHYENGWARYTRSLAAHYEPILWFSRGKRYTYHPLREPYKSTERLQHKIIKNGKVWTPHPDGRLVGDVWKIPTLAGRRFADEKVDHPTQKPLALANRIVGHFSNRGDLVLVPFAGSGTECASAKALGRHFWAAELEPSYAALATRRVEAVPSAKGLLGAGESALPNIVAKRSHGPVDRLP